MWPLLLATSLTIQTPGDLVAAAAATSRPALCGARKPGTGTLWSRTQRPQARAFCALLSRAHVRMESDPKSAREAAQAAAKLAPKHAAPQVVLGQLAARRGDAAAALTAFEKARAADPRSLEAPFALLDYARTLRDSGELGRALEAYRTLVPRASLLPSRTRRAEALLEAAHVALAAPTDPAGGSHDDEALAYLREASRDPFHARRRDVALSLVIALQRAGRIDQADAILAEQRGLKAWAMHPDPDYVIVDADRQLLKALALEGSAPDEARGLYERYVAKPGAFEEIARERLSRLGPRGRRRR